MRQHHAAPLSFAPPQSQQFKELRRKHGIAILASLALFNADQHACRVDVIDLEMRDLRDAPYADLGGGTVRFTDLTSGARYEHAENDLSSTGLYVDLPPWGTICSRWTRPEWPLAHNGTAENFFTD
ncbi:hypothetical protein [Rhizobium sp. 57MFTsu3.2]|uniref:hypothetical protein n=1 Tax=Rhizobium sp. 57MFTsu3.2 TaxID=1048681 RepID=UPI001FEDBE63|nr:hypothetical protein [Rhizobium sp. 57MFTsu3.2]NMN69885.1 hypothetical protein [Rhizobium sp. 57MFTsu3.2]